MQFSVVIPVYNTERYLARCLDSLVAQTDGDFEVVVVDDCSPGAAGSSNPPYRDAVGNDGGAGAVRVVGADLRTARSRAEAIVERYDVRFRFVRHDKNRGTFQARCTGVATTAGDYVVPVDPDDYLMPETLEKIHEAIDRDAPDMISYWIDCDDNENVAPHWCRHPAAMVSGAEALRELAEGRVFTGVASKAFRRETLLSALRELDAPETLYVNTADDFLMLVPALLKSTRVSFLDFAGYRYFINRKSATFSWRKRSGFKRALAQLRMANGLIRRMAERPAVSEDMRALVEDATTGLEDWFVRNHRERGLFFRLWRTFSCRVLIPC